MKFETLELEREEGILWVRLNRPERLNALSRRMVDELRALFQGLPEDRETRLVILRGAGRAFCAGADLKEGGESPEKRVFNLTDTYRAQQWISGIFILMRRAPQPIIACVHGSAAGGGFALALASDIVIAGESARMNVAPIRIGLSGCDVGISYFLPRAIGSSLAAELLLTGNFIDAARAERIGLVSRVVPDAELETTARALAADILRNSPLGVRLTKEGLNASLDAGSLEQVIAIEDRNQVISASSEDFREGVQAFLEKRPAKYPSR